MIRGRRGRGTTRDGWIAEPELRRVDRAASFLRPALKEGGDGNVQHMKITIIGGTGNVGMGLLHELAAEDPDHEVVVVSRREPGSPLPGGASWRRGDVVTDDLVPLVAGSDVVVHLAWAIQPSHDLRHMRRVNVDGSHRVFDAVEQAGVPALVYASSIGSYSPGPKEPRVDEGWATEGIRSNFYSRHKVETERALDAFEQRNPHVRVVRLRTALIFQRGAGSEIRRLFLGPFVPTWLLAPGRLPVVPTLAGLRLQCVHSRDAGQAYRLAITNASASGAYNVATEPVLDNELLRGVLGGRPVGAPAAMAKLVAAAAWRLHLQPTPASWVDLATKTPLMDTTRIRRELGWTPRFDAAATLRDMVDGLRLSSGYDTPPLDPDTGGPARSHEVATGVGVVRD